MHLRNDKPFTYIYMFFILMGPIIPMAYWIIDKNFMYLPKLAYYPAIILILWGVFKSKFILNDWFIKYLIFYSIFIVTFGLALNPISKATFAHILSLALPVLAFSFGFMLAKKKSNFFKTFEKRMLLIGIALSLLIVVYYFLYKTGAIPYFGASTLITIPILYALYKKKYEWMFLFIVAAFFTGKRTIVLGVFIVLLIYLLWLGTKRPLKLLMVSLVLSIIMYFVLINFSEITIFSRFMPFFEEDIDWNVATSGRLNDVLAAIAAINQSDWFWLVGKGIGATFSVENPGVDYVWVTHYTHISPVSYIFLGGILLAIPVYIRLFSLFIFAFKTAGDFYSLLFIYYFIVSFSGAILFTDPFLWVVAGIVFYRQQNFNQVSNKL